MTITCSAQVVLHRYFDTISGEERGICYSDVSGTPAINNPAWSVEVIDEKDKKTYMDLYKAQLKTKADARQALIDKEKGTMRTKLTALGLTSKEIDVLF